MGRPKLERSVQEPPKTNKFKPANVSAYMVDRVTLTLDEYEAIRLADYLGMEHLEASENMGISRSTFTRLIEIARQKLAQGLVDVKEILIEGGPIHFRNNIYKCKDCGSYNRTDIHEPELKKCKNCGSASLQNLAKEYGYEKHSRTKN